MCGVGCVCPAVPACVFVFTLLSRRLTVRARAAHPTECSNSIPPGVKNTRNNGFQGSHRTVLAVRPLIRRIKGYGLGLTHTRNPNPEPRCFPGGWRCGRLNVCVCVFVSG